MPYHPLRRPRPRCRGAGSYFEPVAQKGVKMYFQPVETQALSTRGVNLTSTCTALPHSRRLAAVPPRVHPERLCSQPTLRDAQHVCCAHHHRCPWRKTLFLFAATTRFLSTSRRCSSSPPRRAHRRMPTSRARRSPQSDGVSPRVLMRGRRTIAHTRAAGAEVIRVQNIHSHFYPLSRDPDSSYPSMFPHRASDPSHQSSFLTSQKPRREAYER